MSIFTETILNRWFNDEKNLKILNGIVRHRTDKEIARETGLRIDRVGNYRSKLMKKGLLGTGFYNIDHEKLGLTLVLDFPREPPAVEDTFLVFLVRISRPYGYLRGRLLPSHLVTEGYQLTPGIDVMNNFAVPFVIEDFRTQFEEHFGQTELSLYERNNRKKDVSVDLLSIFICKEVQKGKYGVSTLTKEISSETSEDKLGVKPSISNINDRYKMLKKEGVIFKSNPLNLVPLRPFYSFDSAIVKKKSTFSDTLATLAKLNVLIRYADILNKPDKAYVSLQYHFSQKWDILRILNEKLEEIIFLDHAPSEARRTIPYEYFVNSTFKKRNI